MGSMFSVDVSLLEEKLLMLRNLVEPEVAYAGIGGKVNFGKCGDGTCSMSCSGGCGASCQAWD